MFFRPESSLIPSVLALSSFFINNFPHIFWYPQWYLGNPFSYLVGPIVPGLLLVFSKIAPLGLYNLYLLLLVLSSLIGGVGVYFLVKSFGSPDDSRGKALIAAFLYVFLPFSWIGLYFQNGLKNIAFALVPFIFILIKKFLIGKKIGQSFWIILLIALSLLVTINILLPLIIGVLAILLTINRHRPEKITNLWAWREEKIGQLIIIFLLAITAATFWYTPRFWLVLLTNPSFGGVPLWNLIIKILQNLLNFLPLLLAVLVVKWRFNSQKLSFAFLFFLSFFFLTLVRFLADPKFVIDWIAFLVELQFGISLIIAGFFGWFIKYINRTQSPISKNQNLKLKTNLVITVFFLFITLFSTASGFLLFNLLHYSESDYQKHIISIFESHLEDKSARVFLSGSDVFWINSFIPLNQVRGGNDPASIHPFWAHGAFQIREGESEHLTNDWLKIFGSSYILVHQIKSLDTFHDFKQTEKFTHFQLQADANGDTLYKFPDASIARLADKSLLNLPKPQNGADGLILNKYAASLKKPVPFKFLTPDTISLNSSLNKNEIVSLAVSYDPSWKITTGKGSLTHDSLGNIVILPDSPGQQSFTLKYERSFASLITPLVILILFAILLWKFNSIYPGLRKRLPKIHLGLGSEDEEY